MHPRLLEFRVLKNNQKLKKEEKRKSLSDRVWINPSEGLSFERKETKRTRKKARWRNVGFCASSGRLHPAIQLWFPLLSARRGPLSFAISFSLLKND